MKKLYQKISAAPFIALTLLWFTTQSLAAVTEVTASVDKNPVVVDESFILEIVANDDVSTDAFDPSPLLKDFVVGRTSTSRQTQIINFDTSRTTRWSTVLIPRKPGRFTIPAFTIKGVSTQPVLMQVLPVSQSQNAQPQGIFITTELDMDEVYLLQQVKYTVKLHIALDLQRGSLSAPKMKDGDIEQVGDDKEYNDLVNGHRYRIIERVFSIIPQKSGTYTIEAPFFEGEVLDNNSRQRFGFFNRTKTVNKIGKNLFLTVKPIPDNYSYHWLPSEHVEIHDEWQGMEDALTVGEPVTRTITLTALGVVESQLPEVGSTYPEQVKTYPDQAETATVHRNGTFIAQRKESIAIIPNEHGEIVIPEVQVPWFNVTNGKTQYAVLPEKVLNIKPAVATGTAPTIAPVTAPAEPASANTLPVTLPVQPITNAWWSMSSWILLILWLLTLLLWWLNRNKHPNETKLESAAGNATEAQLWKQVQQAIQQKDAQNLTNYLQQWLAELSGNPQQSLSKSVEQLQNDTLSQQITDLFGNRFGAEQHHQNAKQLFSALMETLKTVRKQYQQKPKIKGTRLHPLYPNTQ